MGLGLGLGQAHRQAVGDERVGELDLVRVKG